MPDIQTKNCPGGYDPFKNQGYLRELKKGIKTIDGRIGLHYDVRHLKEDRMKNDLEKLNQIFETKMEEHTSYYLTSQKVLTSTKKQV